MMCQKIETEDGWVAKLCKLRGWLKTVKFLNFLLTEPGPNTTVPQPPVIVDAPGEMKVKFSLNRPEVVLVEDAMKPNTNALILDVSSSFRWKTVESRLFVVAYCFLSTTASTWILNIKLKESFLSGVELLKSQTISCVDHAVRFCNCWYVDESLLPYNNQEQQHVKCFSAPLLSLSHWFKTWHTQF